MAKKEERFEVVFQDGSQLKDAGTRQILVDKETGVHYLVWRSGYAGGITSAALDGMLTAEAIINELSNLKG